MRLPGTAPALTLPLPAGDRSDTIVAGGPLPLIVDLGPGNDDIEASTASAAVVGGAGRDTILIDALWDAAGPFAIDGGAGDDVIDLLGRAPGMTAGGRRGRRPDQERARSGTVGRRDVRPGRRLTPTNIGRRCPRLPVFVYVRTRSGGDRGVMTFTSRMR